MVRSIVLASLAAGLMAAGCADPAAGKVKVAATAPKPETPAPPDSSTVPPVAHQSDPTPKPDTLEAARPPADALAITSTTSRIDFVGSKVTGSHNGGFRTFTGTADLTPDHQSLAKITVDIDMDSTWADDDKLTGHLKSGDFFDVAKFPRTTFVSTEIKPGGARGSSHTITGNLTMHGVTKSITFPATLRPRPGGLDLTSEFALNRRDFGVNYPGRQNDLIRDDVVLKIDIKANAPG